MEKKIIINISFKSGTSNYVKENLIKEFKREGIFIDNNGETITLEFESAKKGCEWMAEHGRIPDKELLEMALMELMSNPFSYSIDGVKTTTEEEINTITKSDVDKIMKEVFGGLE